MKKILVVDDTYVAIEGFKRMLSPSYELTTTRNPEEAVDLAKDVDLVLTDYRMSPINGNEVAKQIMAKYPNKPIMIVTSSLPRIEERMDRVVYMEKDFHISELIETIESCLE